MSASYRFPLMRAGSLLLAVSAAIGLSACADRAATAPTPPDTAPPTLNSPTTAPDATASHPDTHGTNVGAGPPE